MSRPRMALRAPPTAYGIVQKSGGADAEPMELLRSLLPYRALSAPRGSPEAYRISVRFLDPAEQPSPDLAHGTSLPDVARRLRPGTSAYAVAQSFIVPDQSPSPPEMLDRSWPDSARALRAAASSYFVASTFGFVPETPLTSERIGQSSPDRANRLRASQSTFHVFTTFALADFVAEGPALENRTGLFTANRPFLAAAPRRAGQEAYAVFATFAFSGETPPLELRDSESVPDAVRAPVRAGALAYLVSQTFAVSGPELNTQNRTGVSYPDSTPAPPRAGPQAYQIFTRYLDSPAQMPTTPELTGRALPDSARPRPRASTSAYHVWTTFFPPPEVPTTDLRLGVFMPPAARSASRAPSYDIFLCSPPPADVMATAVSFVPQAAPASRRAAPSAFHVFTTFVVPDEAMWARQAIPDQARRPAQRAAAYAFQIFTTTDEAIWASQALPAQSRRPSRAGQEAYTASTRFLPLPEEPPFSIRIEVPQAVRRAPRPSAEAFTIYATAGPEEPPQAARIHSLADRAVVAPRPARTAYGVLWAGYVPDSVPFAQVAPDRARPPTRAAVRAYDVSATFTLADDPSQLVRSQFAPDVSRAPQRSAPAAYLVTVGPAEFFANVGMQVTCPWVEPYRGLVWTEGFRGLVWFAPGCSGGTLEDGSLTANPALAAPTLSLLVLSDTQIDVSWIDPGVNLRWYVFRNGILIGSPNETVFHDSGLSPSTSYSYQVQGAQNALFTVILSATTNGPNVPGTILPGGLPGG